MRPPKQERSRASLERVIEAATRLLEESGFDGFTIQEVSQRAGVSVGAIYARFGSKKNLLRAVHGHAMDAIGAQHESVGSSDGPSASAAEAITSAVRQLAAVFQRNEGLLRAFMHIGATDDMISRRGSQASIDLAHRFAASVLAHRDEIAHQDPEKAVDVAYRMAYCTFARQVMYGPTFESDRPVSWEELVSEVAHASRAYLLDAGVPRADGRKRRS